MQDLPSKVIWRLDLDTRRGSFKHSQLDETADHNGEAFLHSPNQRHGMSQSLPLGHPLPYNSSFASTLVPARGWPSHGRPAICWTSSQGAFSARNAWFVTDSGPADVGGDFFPHSNTSPPGGPGKPRPSLRSLHANFVRAETQKSKIIHLAWKLCHGKKMHHDIPRWQSVMLPIWVKWC